MIICQECHRENPDDQGICIYCGALLTDPKEIQATRHLDNPDNEEGQPQWGLVRFTPEMRLKLALEEVDNNFNFIGEDFEVLVIGRKDPKTGESPEVDLSEYDALEKGGSRKHAIIMRKDNALHIIDNGSANGTFLNGQRLVAQQPRVLRNGDKIRFGYFVMQITYAHP
ncbi:FHA domain-containing protein [Anaerolineales bacterium]